MLKVIILDRDGVINHDSPDYIKSPEEWLPIEGSLKAIALLCQKSYPVYVATNQSGVGRDYYSMETLTSIHQLMTRSIEAAGGKLAGIFLCPHKPEDQCKCRKPQPGMLIDIFQVAAVTANECVFVGDSKRDLEAAWAAGCHAALVETGNGKNVSLEGAEKAERYSDLLTFAQALPDRRITP